MNQQSFIDHVINIIRHDPEVIGLGIGGSYITNEIDEYSDVDIILVTKYKVAGDQSKMVSYAKSFGDYLSGFTGEHVGEIRVLICLYDNPLLHVDIKFLTTEEFMERVEDPIIVFDRNQVLQNIIASTKSAWPPFNYQWIEDRFWTWIHYTTLKLGRGEYFETLDFLSFLRSTVTAPMLQIKNGKLPRGLRKVESGLDPSDLDRLTNTVSNYTPESLFRGLENTVLLYQELRMDLFPKEINLQSKTEIRSLEYLQEIKKRVLS